MTISAHSNASHESAGLCDKLFEELDKALTDRVHFYIIGGAVMLYHGLKTGTKDIRA